MSFTRSRGEGCLSDLRIDRLIRRELLAEAETQSRAHLATCEVCRARVAEVEALRAAHQASPPPLRRPAPVRRWRGWAVGASTALAAAAALLLVLRPDVPVDGTRQKGGRSASFFVQHAGQIRRGQRGEVVAPGDTLQVQYASATPFYGAILSVDGARHVSRYFPDGDRAAPLEAGSARSFPSSTVLDEVLGPESLFVLLCDQPVALGPIVAALSAEPARPQVPPGCRMERIELEKRAP